VDDLIIGMIRMMNSSDHITGPINLGNPYLVSMKYLAEYIIKLTGSKSKIIHLPMPSDDPVDRCPDISRAIEQLKWRPKITLHNGLIRTINYMRDKV
jgi:UDP-glucuronate decarboxylase